MFQAQGLHKRTNVMGTKEHGVFWCVGEFGTSLKLINISQIIGTWQGVPWERMLGGR